MKALAIAMCGLTGAAAAQAPPTNGRLVFEFDGPTVSPANPSVTLTVSGAWDEAMPGDHAFSAVNYDIAAESGEFTDIELLLGRNPPSNPGNINGNRIENALIGQVVICGISGCLYSVDNPIALAAYTWTATDFTPRLVRFESDGTTDFRVVPLIGGTPAGPSIQLFPAQFSPGFGSITVVPGPESVAALLGGLWLVGRRRR